MAFANNRAAVHPRSTFQTAGGTILRFRHPFLSGQISGASTIDEIDVSKAVKLNDTFLDAMPSHDSSLQEVLVDGSVITITNHLMAGKMTIPVVRTTGLVGTGDFIAAAHLVISSKDDIGGTFTQIETIQGKRIITIFYGVSFSNVPHMKKAGNAVITYPVTMLYAGWVQGVSGDAAFSAKSIWAVGNKYGLKAVYQPYGIQDATISDFYAGTPVGISTTGVDADAADATAGDIDNTAVNTEAVAANTGSSQIAWAAATATP